MVKPLLQYYEMDTIVCLTSCNSARTVQNTENKELYSASSQTLSKLAGKKQEYAGIELFLLDYAWLPVVN